MKNKFDVVRRLALVERDMAEMGEMHDEYGEMEAMAVALRWVLGEGNSGLPDVNIWKTGEGVK